MINDELHEGANCRVDTVSLLSKFNATVDVLRLDTIHPTVSGNKWFKLKKYLQEARLLNKKQVATFGGAYSNHIVATAAAGKMLGFKTVGIIRGEEPKEWSPTLQQAKELNMELHFVSRGDYHDKKIPAALPEENSIYWINEGGYGPKGMEGARTILGLVDSSKYTHIVAAVGTGTTLAGLIAASVEQQKSIGIAAMKNNFGLKEEIANLLPEKKSFELVHDYDFGGYAKGTKELFAFMNAWFQHTGIPSDFVYTGKLFYAVNDLAEKNYFPDGSRLLLIHTGGLQGNRSLPKGTLIF